MGEVTGRVADDGTGGELAARLHARGLRCTPQREQVLSAVRSLEHATPDEIAEHVDGVDVTTVYRTLELLEDIGMVRHTHLGHGAPVYGPADHRHFHVVCHACGAVVDVDQQLVDSLEATLLGDHGFVLDRSHLTIFGTCANCRTDVAAGIEVGSRADGESGGQPHTHSAGRTHEHGAEQIAGARR